MKRLIKMLAHNDEAAQWNAVVWAGVGYGTGLPAVRAMGATHYVYLEPHPQLHAKLMAKFPLSEHETLLPHALWSDSGPRPFFMLSDPLRSSLTAPDEILKTRPNLRVVEEQKVEIAELEGLAARFGLVAGQNNLLILDIGCADGAALAATALKTLAPFSHIALHQPDHGLDANLKATLDLLAMDNSHVSSESDVRSGPRWWVMTRQPGGGRVPLSPAAVLPVETERDVAISTLSAERDQLMQAMAQIGKDRDGFASECDGHAQNIAAMSHRLEQLEPENSGLLIERDHLTQADTTLGAERDELVQANAGLIQRLDKLESEAAILQHERDQLLQSIASLGEEHGAVIAQRDDQLAQAVAALVGERDAIAAQRDELSQANVRLIQRLDKLDSEAAALSAERDQLLQSVASLGEERDIAIVQRDEQAQASAAWQQHFADMEAQLHQAQVERDQFAARLPELEAEIAGACAESCARAEQIERQQQQIAGLTASSVEHEQAAAVLRAGNEQLQRTIDAHEASTAASSVQIDQEKNTVAQLQQGLAEARQAAALSLKLQSLREVDLKDLQERYEESLAVQERQHQMLVKLGERLGAASRYFHQLTESPTAVAIDGFEEGDVVPVVSHAPSPSTATRRRSAAAPTSVHAISTPVRKRPAPVARKKPSARPVAKPAAVRSQPARTKQTAPAKPAKPAKPGLRRKPGTSGARSS